MNKLNNVIDLKSRLKSKNRAQKSSGGATAPVVDMTARRNEMILQERREVRRTILSEFISAFVVIPQRGLQRVSLYDISENGISFDLELEQGRMSVGEEIAARVYMNQYTYFPFVVKVANVRDLPEEGVVRHGTGFVRGTINDVALHHFVKFIETVSASLQTDHGDVMVSNIRK